MSRTQKGNTTQCYNWASNFRRSRFFSADLCAHSGPSIKQLDSSQSCQIYASASKASTCAIIFYCKQIVVKCPLNFLVLTFVFVSSRAHRGSQASVQGCREQKQNVGTTLWKTMQGLNWRETEGFVGWLDLNQQCKNLLQRHSRCTELLRPAANRPPRWPSGEPLNLQLLQMPRDARHPGANNGTSAHERTC